MRKILSLILILGIITGLSSLRILGATETINYDLQFINNKKWDINNGNYVNDTNYMATTRHRIVENDITLNNLNFHHILFWSDNLYLGYYNTTAGGYENSKYLGDTGVNVTVPVNATWFSLTAYKLAPNDLPQTIFNGDTLNDVFTVDYKTTPISTLNNQSLNTVFFTNNNLILNPYFNTNLNSWSITAGVDIWNNGILEFNPTSMFDSVNQSFTAVINNKYYAGMYGKSTLSNTYNMTVYKGGPTFDSWISGVSTINNEYSFMSGIGTATQTTNRIRVLQLVSTPLNTVYVDYFILLDITFLGIDTLSKAQMDSYFTLFQSPNIPLQAFNEYNSLTFTQTQLDDYLAEYTDNQVWVDGISMLLFYSMEASYDREEVIPDERNFLERLSDWFDDFGLGAFPKIVISLVVFIAVAVIMYLFKVSMLGILIIEFVFFVMLVVFGFFPVWLVIVVAIVLLFFIIMALAGGL